MKHDYDDDDEDFDNDDDEVLKHRSLELPVVLMMLYYIYDLNYFILWRWPIIICLSFLTGCPNLSHHCIFLAHPKVFLIRFRLSIVKRGIYVSTVMPNSQSGLSGLSLHYSQLPVK